MSIFFGRCYRKVESEHAGVDEKFLFNEALQLMQNILTDDLIETTGRNTLAIGAECLADVRRHPTRLALFSPQVEAERLQEKRYLYDTLYTCEPLETEHDKAEEVVTALFDHWINDPEELPVSHFEEVRERGACARGGGLYCRHDGQLHPAAIRADQARRPLLSACSR